MDERRKHPRLQKNERTDVSKEGSTQEVNLVDISLGGMRITMDKQIQSGSAISGQFKILPNMGPFYVQGEVAWVKPKEEADKKDYEIGIKFNKISTIPF